MDEHIPHSMDAITRIYTRCNSTARAELAQAMCTAYNVPECKILSSGMNAIYSILDSLALHFQTGSFIISSHLYGETTSKIIKDLQKRHPHITFNRIDIYTTSKKTFQNPDIKVLYLESCSNPEGYIFDPEYIAAVPDHAYVVMDNTWLSPAVFNPFLHGANIVVESTAKYLSGGQCIMGIACFRQENDPIAALLENFITTLGIHVSSEYCNIVTRALPSLNTRTDISYARTLEVLQYLKQHPQISKIQHPTISHPDRMEKFIKGGPSVLRFHRKTKNVSRTALRERVRETALASGFNCVTSFGHPFDSIDCYPQVDRTGVWIRLAVGYENDTTLLEKLEKFITTF